MSLNNQMQEIREMLATQPVAGLSLSVGQLIFGIILGVVPDAPGISPLIKDLFQIGAWLGAILVALFTILSIIKQHTTLFDRWKHLKK